MHYATLVCGHQAARELTSERKHFFFRQRSSSQLAVEGGPLDILHREKINTALAIEVVDGGNIGMVKLGERKGFLAKTLTADSSASVPAGSNFSGTSGSRRSSRAR